MNRPCNWGNDGKHQEMLVNDDSATTGSRREQLWYHKPTSFILDSMARTTYWTSVAGKR